jgi:hypothetical protein
VTHGSLGAASPDEVDRSAAEGFGLDEADAIDAVNALLAEVYPGHEPRHFGTVRRFAEGGSAPLDGISVYAGEPAHWHFVSYGMSPWGFEFSFRIARGPEAEPPQWPLVFLQQLGRYVYNTGEPFGPGHFIAWDGPIAAAAPTALVALVFAADPVLGSVVVGGERLAFLAPVGIIAAEFAACAQNRPEAVLAELLAASPLGVVELGRGGRGDPGAAADPARPAGSTGFSGPPGGPGSISLSFGEEGAADDRQG